MMSIGGALKIRNYFIRSRLGGEQHDAVTFWSVPNFDQLISIL